MMLVFMVLAVILSVALIVLVTIQPRQTQIFSTVPLVISVNQVIGLANRFEKC